MLAGCTLHDGLDSEVLYSVQIKTYLYEIETRN